MAYKAFGEWRPDVSDFQSDYTQTVQNVFPKGDGYGPVPDLAAYTSALSTACRGYFFARNPDGTVAVFAGTASHLYKLDNTSLTFTDISKGASTYATLSSSANWGFAQFNNFVIGVQQNVAPQIYSLTTSTAFGDLGGSPPQAAYVTVVNRFLVLSGIQSPNSYRVQWSGLNDINSSQAWTSGVNSSDFQDLPDGGIVQGVAGGEFGVIMQEASIRRMTFAPGSPYVFGIDRIAQDDGLYAPYSLIAAADRVFYLGPAGFRMILPGGYPQPIGKERVDRTFLADVDTANIQLCIGGHDPNSTRVYWTYKSINGATGLFDKILVYDWILDKWSLIVISGEYIASLAKPGITLEGVDTAYGSNIDTLTIPSLDSISSASLASLSAVDPTHKVGFFTGANLEAQLVTGEQGDGGQRIYVNGIRGITDAPTFFGSVSMRENPQAATVYSTETDLDTKTGVCPARISTRYARGKIRIPEGQNWTYAAGVEPEVRLEGQR